MSPRRRRASRGAGARPARPPRPRWRAWWPAAAVLLVAAVAWLALHRPPASPTGARAADDPLASADLLTLYRTAVTLARAGHHAASLPYFQRLEDISHGPSWQLHFNYGSALYNTTIQVDARGGRPVAATRSSYERVRLASAAERELDTAERQARAPGDLAFIRASRARMTWLWGFPWETLGSYRRALEAAPARADIARQGRAFMALMRSPTTSTLREPDVTVPAPR